MKKIFLCILIIAGFSSCSKFLDQEPLSTSTDDSFWKDEAEAESAIAGSYALVRQAFNLVEGVSFFAYGDLVSDEILSSNLSDLGPVVQLNPTGYVPSGEPWRNLRRLRRFDLFYRAIDQASRCIAFIPNIPASEFSSEEERNRLIGEAYFLRAFNYFYMTRIWGDVPLVSGAVNVSSAVNLPRTPQAEVLSSCIKDIETAISLLPWQYASASDKAVRANKGSAYALLAHLYAWMGEYEKCALAADEVVKQETLYGFVSRDSLSYRGIYKGGSNEGVFEIAQSGENEGTILGIGRFTLAAPYITGKTGVEIVIDSNTVYRMFPKGTTDKRFRSCFNLSNTAAPMCTKYANISYVGGGQSSAATPLFRNNIVVFRYSDIYLLRAEALAATGQYSAARTMLNKIRSLADATAVNIPDHLLFEEIIEERGRELFLEGHRFYDVIRLTRKDVSKVSFFGTTAIGPKMTTTDFLQGKYYWPLDPSLLNENKLLTQTPFWNSKI
ncbi:RagB/SusD family nutrient uptake outer membrane protein [Desertivirga arenae]|uniref:RagB/SusD family nutrient uptake outer membrane protein n=1 Tax=Desertivirga arenae TaxID=2810309 RepID=UPI001A9773C8|nr:RagB/SusD family nutrient uptake outer membrane protein [Pedobacter sp. SYSU D00823]